VESVFTTLQKDSFSKYLVVALQLGQQCCSFIDYFERSLTDSRLLDRLLPGALIDRNLLITKYKGFENVYKAHLIARLREKCYFCFIVERDWLRETSRDWLV
jgi:hypothetical protein